ncbi:MAG: class I SAM-dependent methyltransferase [Actinomycetota bacterium]|nr:class I SAM-dependent methyltransferase [Actinomycetota bacterium]
MDHHDIVRACEGDFEEFGDSFQGAGWTKAEELADRRYEVMLDVIDDQPRPTSVLDFGCGSARLLDYAIRSGRADGLVYSGLDLSSRVIEHCRAKYPDRTFHQLDVLASTAGLPVFDTILLNGVFHYKGEMAQEAMFDYFCALLRTVRPHAGRTLAFNVMSTHVEWTRDDLFHLPIQQATDFVATELSRRFVVRQDYGLYEYTVYVYL